MATLSIYTSLVFFSTVYYQKFMSEIDVEMSDRDIVFLGDYALELELSSK